ncbi:hypothetical protein HDU98_003167 [Podochytrium sp. JEL0797]|nr:hypothetical protein HDU98_003167 [Podochytrium sp. JEL0797]
MAVICPAMFEGPVLGTGWLDYINCGETPTPSSNTNWPPAGCPNPVPPPNTSGWPTANALSFPAEYDSGFGPKLHSDQMYAIQSLVWVAENSVANLDGVIPWSTAYPYIQNIGDGRGYTMNIVGFCSGTGDFADMLTYLQKLEPCNPLVKYLPDVQKLSAGAGSGNLTGLAGLAEEVVQQGGGPNGTGPINPNYIQATWNTIMAPASVAGSNYWGQAMALSRQYKLSLPISKGQLYDVALNAGTQAVIQIASSVTVRSPTAKESGGPVEKKWLLAFQEKWIQYILATPTIDDLQTDRGIMWQHLVNPKNGTLSTSGQVGANNKKPNLHLELPLSVNCYGHTLTIRAPRKN